MDRLAFVGHSAMGALPFSPSLNYLREDDHDTNIDRLGVNAQAIFDGQT